jgi:hypothetical protein
MPGHSPVEPPPRIGHPGTIFFQRHVENRGPHSTKSTQSAAVNFQGLDYDHATFIKVDLVFGQAS